MRLLVFGTTGQVAQELLCCAGPQTEIIALDRAAANLEAPEACAETIRCADVDAVINAAAYTAVDRAETERDLAQVINGDAPVAMARACAARDLPFLHISTDYVFDGTGEEPHAETEPTNPVNIYGKTKRAGERGILAAGGRHAILRTSWVFSAHGANFVKTMLRLSETRNALDVVADQVGGPTPAADIAAACIVMARKMRAGQPGGIYHFAGCPDVSWADFAREIFRQTARDVTVTDIATAAYPTPAARPLNSRLNCAKITREFGIGRPDWRRGLAQVLMELQQGQTA